MPCPRYHQRMDYFSLSSVFVPAKFPKYTYNPRTSAQLETRLGELVEDGGAIVCISGLTKMGKTVLAKKVFPATESVWVTGGGFNTCDDFWKIIGDELGAYSNISITSTTADTVSTTASGEVGFPGFGKAGAQASYGDMQSNQTTRGVERPALSVMLEALRKSERTLIVDDFHFIPRELQKEIVRSLKGPLFDGLKVVTISTSHRVLDVIFAEPNMDGRAIPLDVSLWTQEELKEIPSRGFSVLNLRDRGDVITRKLAENAFGSPHLMQTFCRQICRDNNHKRTATVVQDLVEPPDWSEFFRKQAHGVSERWFDRLLRGPQERGNARKEWPRKAGGSADNYALIMEAMTQAVAEAVEQKKDAFVISKDRIKQLVDGIVAGPGPAADQTTRALQRISNIAARPFGGDAPSVDELEYSSQVDTHYMLEYMDEGPSSRVHVIDPFFLYYLRWGAPSKFSQTSI